MYAPDESSHSSQDVGVSLIPTLQVRRLRPRGFTTIARGRAASKWQSLDSKAGSKASEHVFSVTTSWWISGR